MASSPLFSVTLPPEAHPVSSYPTCKELELRSIKGKPDWCDPGADLSWTHLDDFVVTLASSTFCSSFLEFLASYRLCFPTLELHPVLLDHRSRTRTIIDSTYTSGLLAVVLQHQRVVLTSTVPLALHIHFPAMFSGRCSRLQRGARLSLGPSCRCRLADPFAWGIYPPGGRLYHYQRQRSKFRPVAFKTCHISAT